MARQASALQNALHADLFVLAQSGRALLCRPDGRCDPRRSFASVNERVRDIETYLAERNANPKPYKWKAKGAEILSKIKHARAALDKAGVA